jgi:hypothetical protein
MGKVGLLYKIRSEYKATKKREHILSLKQYIKHLWRQVKIGIREPTLAQKLQLRTSTT